MKTSVHNMPTGVIRHLAVTGGELLWLLRAEGLIRLIGRNALPLPFCVACTYIHTYIRMYVCTHTYTCTHTSAVKLPRVIVTFRTPAEQQAKSPLALHALTAGATLTGCTPYSGLCALCPGIWRWRVVIEQEH